MTAPRGLAAAQAAREAETAWRLRELEWLIDGGVWPPSACARVGWSLTAAEFATRHRDSRLHSVISPFVRETRRTP